MVYSNRPKGLVPSLYIIGDDMPTHETIKAYLDKVLAGKAEVDVAVEQARENLSTLESQSLVITGQIVALENLMDHDNLTPVVEMPIVDEETMSAAHDKRLNMFDDTTPEEYFEGRQDAIYKREARDFVETIDSINNEEAQSERDKHS